LSKSQTFLLSMLMCAASALVTASCGSQAMTLTAACRLARFLLLV
jgi:hypothetical protein